MSSIPSITLSLADFADGAALNTTAKIRGKEVSVRPLSLHEKNILIAAHPAPVPPLKKPTDKGTLAEPVPDISDADFVTADRVHTRERSVLMAAASAGWTPAPSEVGLAPMTLAQAAAANRAKDWVKRTLIEWQGTDGQPGLALGEDIMNVNSAVAALETAGSAGNSSAPAKAPSAKAPSAKAAGAGKAAS